MPFDLPELLGPYLLPALIAVPLAVVVYFISARRGDDSPPPSRREPKRADGRGEPHAAAAVDAAPASAPAASAGPTGPSSLLVVDDSAVARAKLGKLFEAAGYQVTLARDGVEALDRLAEQGFAVLVTDLEMPNKDGFELIAAVQGSMETEDLPIIAITGHEELQARVHQVQGLYGIFKKPWNDRELLKRVETLASLPKPIRK